MKRFAILGLLASVLGACGQQVEVPPAHVGKILTSDGFRKELLPPSKFRLEVCFSLCDKLVTLEAADWGVREQLRLFMPKDQLNLAVDVRGVFAISANQQNVSKVFARVSPENKTARWSHISLKRVYTIYAKQIIRNSVRSLLITYSIDQIMENRKAISDQLFQQVRQELATTPITVTQFGLADVQPPKVIVEAKELAKKREVAIRQAEADKQIALKKAEAELELAEKNKAIRLKNAEAILLENNEVAGSVTQKYLAYRYLEVMEQMAKSGNTVFFPVEMTRPVGLQNRLFQETVKSARRQ